MKGLKKLGNKRGFSLFESIVALLVISILTVGITTGVNAAVSVYKKSLSYTEAEVLATTIDIALSDVLRYSSSIDKKEEEGKEDVIHFTNANYGVINGYLCLRDGRIYLNQTFEEDDGAPPLLNGGMYTSMKIDSFTLTYKDEFFSGEYEVQSKENSTLNKSYNFCFRTLAE